jgi:ComF family protein
MARSWVIYEGPIRHALHTLKYRRNISLGETLANAISEHLMNMNWDIDIVIPVPLGMKRLSERGYNQVALVAMPLAAKLGLEFSPRSLERSSETRSQVGLSAEERKLNVEGAFRAKPNGISGKNVLLMDDVATTGATLSSCASALLNAGAGKVFGFTIARVLPQHGLMMI